MMDILRDPIWQFWGVIVGILGLLVAIIIYLLQRNKKRLTYSILTSTPLLSVDDEIKGDIKIQYKKSFIQNIHLVVLKIENRGSTYIASSDYEQPLLFSFEDSKILSAELLEASPKNLKPTIQTEPSRMVVSPLLLNRGDYITVKLLFSQFKNRIDADARILGIKTVEKLVSDEKRLLKLITVSMFVAMLLSAAYSYFTLHDLNLVLDHILVLIVFTVMLQVLIHSRK